MFIFTPLNQILFRVLLKGKAGGDDKKEQEESLIEEKTAAQLKAKREMLLNSRDTKFSTLFKRFDELILKPILIRDYEERHHVIKSMKHKEENTTAASTKNSFYDPVMFLRKAPKKRRHSFDAVNRDTNPIDLEGETIHSRLTLQSRRSDRTSQGVNQKEEVKILPQEITRSSRSSTLSLGLINKR
jgi:hypothetical protein